MINIILHKFKNLISEKPARNNLTVLDDDVFLVSYPRSGNTWIRFLIGNLIFDNSINWQNIDNKIPDIYRLSDSKLLKIQRPRILKSHHSYNPLYPKVVYIIRDVRDVCISYYYHKMKYLRMKLNFDDFLNDFIKGNLDDFGTYSKNYKSWMRMEDEIKNGLLLIKYEELKENTDLSLRKITDFMGIQKSDNQIKAAIQRSNFTNMKNSEIKSANKSGIFIDSDKKINFVRKGKSGAWKEFLNKSQHEILLDNFGDVLKELNYDISF